MVFFVKNILLTRVSRRRICEEWWGQVGPNIHFGCDLGVNLQETAGSCGKLQEVREVKLWLILLDFLLLQQFYNLLKTRDD